MNGIVLGNAACNCKKCATVSTVFVYNIIYYVYQDSTNIYTVHGKILEG